MSGLKYFHIVLLDICDAIQLKADPNVVFHNEDVDLKCNCSGVPSPSYTWTKDGRLLGDSGKVLRISKAQLSDSGIYQCTANSSVRRTPRNSSQYTLNIIGELISFFAIFIPSH